MNRLILRNLTILKGRYLLAGLTIAIGAAFVCSNLIISNGIKNSLANTLASGDQKADVFITPVHPHILSYNARGIPVSFVQLIKQLDSVKEVNAEIIAPVAVTDERNHTIGAFGASVGISALSYNNNPWVFLQQGKFPSSTNQVDVDQNTFYALGGHLGNSLSIFNKNGVRTNYRVVGVIKTTPSQLDLFGSTIAFNFKQAENTLGVNGFAQLAIITKSNYKASQVANQIKDLANEVGSENEVNVQTAAEKLKADEAQVITATQVLSTALNVFALIAIIIAGVIVANTLRISAFQRERQLALLRLIGAARYQMFQLMILEAVSLGVVFAIAGIPLGVIMALLAQGVIRHFGFSFSINVFSSGLTIFVYPVVVGLVTSVIGGILPAKIVSNFSPIAALENVGDLKAQGKVSIFRIISGAVALTVGGLIIYLTISSHSSILLTAIGGAVVFIGLLILQPLVVPAYSMTLGAVFYRVFGFVGNLAGRNMAKNPIRSSATAASITIGLSLVVLFSTVFSSITASVEAVVFQKVPFDYLIVSTFKGVSLPEGLASDLTRYPKLFISNPVYSLKADLNGLNTDLALVNPNFFENVKIGFLKGVAGYLGQNDIVVDQNVASRLNLRVGSSVLVTLKNQEPSSLQASNLVMQKKVLAIVPAATFIPPVIMGNSECRQRCYNAFLGEIFINAQKGVPIKELDKVLQHVVDPYPFAAIENLETLKGMLSNAVNTIIVVFDALLSVALLIAFFGITNTLSLSIIERIREIGVLKAIGMSRWQIFLTLVYEGVLLGIFGALCGMLIGLLAAFGIIQALKSQGINIFSVPEKQLMMYFIIALIVSAIASFLPAYRGSKLSPIKAMYYI